MEVTCRRCLLKDLTDGEYFSSVYEYIESLDMEIRTSQKEYQCRLTACEQCSHLVNGMCELCGCFVEVRAAKKGSHCAGNVRMW
jgi:hypothetical protein